VLRNAGLLGLGALLVLAALATGEAYVFFLVYLGFGVLGAAYVVARRGLADLEAGSWPDREHTTVGEVLTVSYTVRNRSRLPKPWLEVHSPSTLPLAIPGRALSILPRRARSWAARVPLTERGQFRVDPMVVRTGDPFGLFESVASVGPPATVLVYPPVERLAGWRLPPAPVEGTRSRPEHSTTQTPLATSVRPYTPGDAFNRIHWRSSARHQELQVKEFDVEQTADVWLYLDLERAWHTGQGQRATIETAVRAAAAIAAEALEEGRGVGVEAVAARRSVIAIDRGPRQLQKILGLLAVVQPDGATPLAEVLADSAPHLRRGSVVIVISPSLDRSWVAPLAALGARGVRAVACIVDPVAHAVETPGRSNGAAAGERGPLRSPGDRDLLKDALLEHGIAAYVLAPGVALSQQLVSSGPSPVSAARR
jgi:uncharacterized protein (DUF58 family)